MRDEFGDDISDDKLLDALTNTRVALIADTANLLSHSAQTTFITTAMLMARSGHEVSLIAPDAMMIGPQPPLRPGTIIEQLSLVGTDLLPGLQFKIGDPQGEIDLAIALGDAPFCVRARRRIRLNATAWAGSIIPEDQLRPWQATIWPFGGLAAAGLGAGEALKAAIYKLLPFALSPANTNARFLPMGEISFELAVGNTPFCRDLGHIDCISGGAITNAVLYCLARIPGVAARGRIIEHDIAGVTNLNRNMLLLHSGCETPKAEGLAQMLGTSLCFEPLLKRYDSKLASTVAPLAPTVIAGVDHIPTRWMVQQANPRFLVVGATSHWSAMASFHSHGLGCAHCLHDQDDRGNEPVATTACVSFWAGLLSAVYIARRAAGETLSVREQQVYLSPFSPSYSSSDC
jgi:hypothetical protein